MMKKILSVVITACALVTLPFTSALAASGAYPSRPIVLVVPFAPGGTTDLLGRLVAKGLSENLGVSVVVENRPGAGGNIGSNSVVKATPDGYTLLLGGAGHLVILPSIMPGFPFDPYKSLEPVALVGTAMNVLIANPKSPFQHVKDVADYARENPKSLNYASGGNGGVIHLAAELFAHQANVELTHIPYKGSSAAYGDLVSGRVQIMFDNLPSALPYIRSGQMRAIAVTGEERSPELPDVPTMQQEGMPDYVATSWWGILAPAGTPPDIVNQLNKALAQVVEREKEAMVRLGATPVHSTEATFRRVMVEDGKKWEAIIKSAGIEGL
ncbi:Bug family tripartite tricarboxylate transporter substrate binding protein [Allopusillimonas ginsengisoli]|uniref:Bug family tripartite tricarboxylate transporter substrate binding protein n=1 Tax=Allopusillimonas ginsengisoli TaxID=453575 RepID=UPI001FD63865|nr:tripartite tricarboxylate transporter substrate binding protein [Allopusillimonas ginsengisoli]